MFRSALAALSACTLLGGCAALGALGQAAEPQDAFQIQAPAEGPVARAPRAEDLIVEIPAASGAIDTDRILIRPQATQVQYLSDARWIEPAPLMIQSALVEGLERSGGFRFVGRKPLGASGDVALVSNLVDFHAAIAPDTPGATVAVRLAVRLVREEDAAVISSRTFAAGATAPDTSTPALVDAYDRATSRVIGEAVSWVLNQRGR
ncbi:ABC-type transport auxiliary lipoprotein family protein [Defluviimonas sp. D31]|uniref:ABC-type transport auxiliary lipoprotein family protein n=1 Tax=Defluviimonas sp. D31 TaxID=3083253 RepID=UPI00296EE753|nr:ABC-type transport auxiliary lipoprotein family protein [Defluviimonas sp. D31]MDW4549267.1 ABC-type transport auxiliary lipoprotein family protein [Defluviimonas sp. D31]